MGVVRASNMSYPTQTHTFVVTAVVTALDCTQLNANPLSLVGYSCFITNIHNHIENYNTILINTVNFAH